MTKPIMYKLVTQNYMSYGGMFWKIGVTNSVKHKIGNTMCTNEVLHCYEDPYLANMFNVIHANIPNPRLLKIECSEIVASDKLKFACKEQTPIEELPFPILSLNQKIAFGIKSALVVYHKESFVRWASAWLEGSNRTAVSANAAAYAAVNAAANAAYAAVNAAYAAVNAAAEGVTAAANAAYYAAYAAEARELLNFKQIMQEVLEMKTL